MLLALDLGTLCGWCLRDGDQIVSSGTWDLRPKRYEGGGMRFVRFKKRLEELLALAYIDHIAYEEVRRHAGTDAAHVYGGFQSHLLVFSETRKIPTEAIPVGTIKKKATGKGNSNKSAMIAAANVRWPSIRITSDNEADALWISECAVAS